MKTRGRPRIGELPLTPAERKRRQRQRERDWLASDNEYAFRRKLIGCVYLDAVGDRLSDDEICRSLFQLFTSVQLYRDLRKYRPGLPDDNERMAFAAYQRGSAFMATVKQIGLCDAECASRNSAPDDGEQRA